MVNIVIVSVIVVTMLMIRAVIMLKVRGGNREQADTREEGESRAATSGQDDRRSEGDVLIASITVTSNTPLCILFSSLRKAICSFGLSPAVWTEVIQTTDCRLKCRVWVFREIETIHNQNLN